MRSVSGVDFARLPRRYDQPLASARTTAIHSSPFHNHVASTAVSGSRANPTASCWASVLFLAILLAGTLTPFDPTTVRYMLMTNSRAAMITTGTTQNTPLPTSVNMAPSTSTLSASGSRNAPERVVPWRRATQPSNASLAHSANHSRKAIQPPSGPSGMTQNMSGDSSSRPTVMALAHVASAPGSTMPCSVLAV